MQVWEAFILLVVIMDPVVSIAALMSLSGGGRQERKAIIKKAFCVAVFVFLIFAVAGDAVLRVLGVEFESFKVAGGIILVILGIQLALGITKPKKENVSETAVVIGTPLISGPAVIMTTMILVKEIGIYSTLAAGIGALLVVLASLLLASRITGLMGRGGLKVLSTMMGMVTVAWGIQFIFSGVLGML